jgi:tetratricopeptide (TPR) repeat protein
LKALSGKARLWFLCCCFGVNDLRADDEIATFMSLWDYNDPAETEAKFRAQLGDARESDNVQYHPALLSQIARTYSLRREFTTSHEILTEAEGLLGQDMPVAETMILLERGRAYNSNKEIDKALPYFRQAFALADKARLDALAVDAAHMIGIAETQARSTRWNLIAMAIAETSEDEGAQGWLGSLYNNLGWSYFDEGELNQALILFEKGVAYREKMKQTREWQIARWTVARTYRELGRDDEAMAIQLKLLTEVGEDTSQLGYIHEELGELCLASDEKETITTSHFRQAHEILSKDDWLQANEADRLERLAQLGKVGQ